MNRLKALIIIIIIAIVILIITLMLFQKNVLPGFSSSNDIKIKEEENHLIEEKQEQIDSTIYFCAKSIINEYLNLTYKNDSRYFNRDGERIISEEQIYEQIYQILSDNYIQEKNITKSNIDNFINLIDKKVTFVPLNMQYIGVNGNVKTILAEGCVMQNDNKIVKESKFLANVDIVNFTCSVEPVNETKKYTSYVKGNIEKKDNNICMIPSVNIQLLAQEYINIYKAVVTSAPQYIYTKLDEEYAKVRFGSQDKFEEYVKNNITDLNNIIFTKYLVNTYTDYTEYVCQDQYERLYIFKVKDDMLDYTIELDDYTLPDEELDEKYMNLSTQEKVVNNINKWIKMLNYRDYESAFNVLDETFRTQNFGNDVNKFEQYMRVRFPEHYKFDQVEYSQEAGISEQKITMSDVSGKSETKIEETIYMQLREGTDFRMSFNII